MKVLRKIGLDCLLYNYYICQNTHKRYMIVDADFSTINMNDVLMVTAHLKDKHDSETSIGAYNAALSFLKDYITELRWSDVEFAPLFKTNNLLAPVDTSLEEIDLPNEGPISEPELWYMYKKKNFDKK